MDSACAMVSTVTEVPSVLISSFVVFTAAIVCFVNSIDASFAFDDSEAIINNKDLNPASSNLSDLFFHDFWGNKIDSNVSHKSYRPLTVLTFRLNYWFAGGLHPMSFHVVNIFLHGVVSWLFLIVFTIIVRDGKKHHSRHHRMLPLISALLFAVHPIHTENVAAVVGRADLLCALCFALAFISYAEALHSGFSSLILFSLVLPLVICSVLFKEQGITVFSVCAVYDIVVVNRVHPKTFVCKLFRSIITKNNHFQRSHFSLIARLLLIVLFAAILLFIRWMIMGRQTPTFHPADNPQSFINHTVFRVINYNYLYSLNAWLLLNPWWLCFDWSMGCVPLITRLSDLRLIAVLVFLIVLCFLLVSATNQEESTEQRYLLMSLSLLLFPFIPASNILFRVGFVIAERNLYLSSAGFVMIVGLGITKLVRIRRRLCYCLVSFLILTHLLRSVQRSGEWRSEKVLFESGANVCPLNAKVHYNIAKMYSDEGNVELAMSRYQLAIRLNPQYDQALNNLGNLLKDKGNLNEAETLLQQAVEIRPEFSAAWMNLGIVQSSLKKYNLAEMSYLTALRHRTNYPDCYYNLGNLYLEENRHAEALIAWQNATFQKPKHLSAWTNLILLLDNLGRISDLKIVASVALKHNPNESSIHFNFANALGKAASQGSGLFEESEKHFLTAIELNNKVATYHSNLGVLYHRWGKLILAEEAYKHALILDPNSKQTTDNLQLLYNKLGKN